MRTVVRWYPERFERPVRPTASVRCKYNCESKSYWVIRSTDVAFHDCGFASVAPYFWRIADAHPSVVTPSMSIRIILQYSTLVSFRRLDRTAGHIDLLNCSTLHLVVMGCKLCAENLPLLRVLNTIGEPSPDLGALVSLKEPCLKLVTGSTIVLPSVLAQFSFFSDW